MASFKDRKGQDWQIILDAPTIEEIRSEHGVDLVGLDNDPLRHLRNDPMQLVTVVSVICREQQEERNLKPAQFGKLLPSPPDTMLEAVRDAVIGFFPSGRASHVREVLSKYDQMAGKTDELAAAKMQQVMDDPAVMKQLNRKADQVISQQIEKMALDAGTPNSTVGTSSTS